MVLTKESFMKKISVVFLVFTMFFFAACGGGGNSGKNNGREPTDCTDDDCGICTPGETRPCYDGPDGTEGVGICKAGVETCLAGKEWSECAGQVIPQDEICDNGIDENCDGRDCEPCTPGETRPCYDGPDGTEGIGICKAGVETCLEDGNWGECSGQVTPQEETCDNGIDEDCDGDDCTVPPVCEFLESGKTCEVTQGNGAKLIKGNVLSGDKIYKEVLIGQDGFIACAGNDCHNEEAANGATVINCPCATVTPALINGHDHLGYVNNMPGDWKNERFDHRHEWRKGKNGHTKLDVPGGATVVQKQWAELRQLMAGTLAITGSGGAKGFLRNIDQNFVDTFGLDGMDVKYQTFPLGDSNGNMVESGCSDYKMDTASVLQADCYLPHVSEGINKAARNEMLCLTGRQEGGIDLAKENSAFVHSVGIIAEDGEELAKSKTAIIWSARTNVSLYGNTAPVTMLKNQGVLIGLGTDWVASGSMHILRELACVDYLNKNHFAKTFSDYEIWQMATVNNAAALRILDVTGAIRPGLVGDIVVFDARDAVNPYRAVIEGHEKKVALVLRGGQVFYGDADVVSALDKANECEAISVCDVDKKVCVKEIGMTLSEFQNANSDQYKLFYCGTPEDEPTCVPQRTRSQDESNPYSGPTATDTDGDGIVDEEDNCPDIFNPIRPVDNGRQADSDGDEIGDACDKCPLAKNVDNCDAVDPDDKDGDGVPNALDNCPFDSNPGQEDSDGNTVGDACDLTVTTIYDIKKGGIQTGRRVTVEGIVTVFKSNNFFMQVDPADHDATLKEQFSGIYVYKSTLPVNVGDKVRVSGKVMDYYDQLQIANIESVEVVKANKGVPDFVTVDPAKVKNDGEQKDAYNGVLVRVENVDVTEAADSYHVFGVTGGLKVDDDFYSFVDPEVGTHFAEIRGVLAYTFSNSKILPRFAEDYVIDNCGNSSCDESWSQCEPATGECIPKEGFCDSKEECLGEGRVCDIATHQCAEGDPCAEVECEAEYSECSGYYGTCVAKEGMCINSSDCTASEECDLTTHTCREIPSILKNGGFESWTDGLPDFWKGSTTNITAGNIVKETENLHSGTAALKLLGISSGSKRFSSQAVSLDAGTYSCEFYATGTASAGPRVYYNGTYASGAIAYTELSSSWQKLTHSFTLDSAVTDFEFLFYVKAAATGDYIIVDDIVCTKN